MRRRADSIQGWGRGDWTHPGEILAVPESRGRAGAPFHAEPFNHPHSVVPRALACKQRDLHGLSFLLCYARGLDKMMPRRDILEPTYWA